MKTPEQLYEENYKGFTSHSAVDAHKKGFISGVNAARIKEDHKPEPKLNFDVLVSCSSFDEELCPSHCAHKKEHAPKDGEYDTPGAYGPCTGGECRCGNRVDEPICICS